MKVKIIGDEYDQSKIFIVYFYIALSYHTALYIKKRWSDTARHRKLSE